MVEFKSWRDFYLFLKEYAVASCLNCHYGGKELDLNEEHSDSEYSTVFCIRTISMVRRNFMTGCAEWVDKYTGKTIEDFPNDTLAWKFSEEVLDVIDELNKEVSFDEIKEIIANEEHKE